MTRFEMEYSGKLGVYWLKNAEQDLQNLKDQIANGEITFDNGIARNKIGRVVTKDIQVMLSYVTDVMDEFDADATEKARQEETRKALDEYIKANYKPSFEEQMEMRNAFGEGAKVVDIITGQTFTA